jgi:hypothetical protein
LNLDVDLDLDLDLDLDRNRNRNLNGPHLSSLASNTASLLANASLRVAHGERTMTHHVTEPEVPVPVPVPVPVHV